MENVREIKRWIIEATSANKKSIDLNALFIPSVISTGQVDIFPLGVGVNTLTNGIYVANRGEDNVSIIVEIQILLLLPF